MKQKRFVIRLNRDGGYYWRSRDGRGGWQFTGNVGVARRFTKAEADEAFSDYNSRWIQTDPDKHSFLEIDENGQLV